MWGIVAILKLTQMLTQTNQPYLSHNEDLSGCTLVEVHCGSGVAVMWEIKNTHIHVLVTF